MNKVMRGSTWRTQISRYSSEYPSSSRSASFELNLFLWTGFSLNCTCFVNWPVEAKELPALVLYQSWAVRASLVLANGCLCLSWPETMMRAAVIQYLSCLFASQILKCLSIFQMEVEWLLPHSHHRHSHGWLTVSIMEITIHHWEKLLRLHGQWHMTIFKSLISSFWNCVFNLTSPATLCMPWSLYLSHSTEIICVVLSLSGFFLGFHLL